MENHSLDLDYVAVKAPMFSFSRLVGADPMLGVEMASTGEVGCFGDDLHEALLHAPLTTGFKVPRKAVLLSLGPLTDKHCFADQARVLSRDMGLKLYATHGTAEALTTLGIDCTKLAKRPENGAMTGMHAIEQGPVDLVINIGTTSGRGHRARHRRSAGPGHYRGPTESARPGHTLFWEEYAARRRVTLK